MYWDWGFWWMALLPLAVLAWRHSRGIRFPRIWWIVASVLAVSWLADTVAVCVPSGARWAVSFTYPSVQAVVLAFALLDVWAAWRFVGLLVAMAIVSGSLHGVGTAEDGLRTVAWIGGGVIAWEAHVPRMVRYTLLATFGLGWFAWFVYTVTPMVSTWFVYQGVRAMGIAVFTVGALQAPQEAS